MAQSLHWCFTINNYDEAELDALRKSLSDGKETKYALFGKEKGDEGTEHLQGYVSFVKRKRLRAVKALVGQRSHVEVARGNERQNTAYCKKGLQSKHEWETQGTTGPNYGKDADVTFFGSPSDPGKRNDLEAFKDAVKDGERNPKRLREEHSEVAARYPRFFDAYIRDQVPVPEVEKHPLNEWQQELNDYLKKPPDKRTVTFVVDRDGKKGKTWFAEYYCELHDNATFLEPGKKADMAYAMPDEVRVLFINCTREQVEYLQYTFLESCKDGRVFSTKYESRVKRYEPMHVVVMMNQMPDMTKLSPDRYQIIDVTDSKLEKEN